MGQQSPARKARVRCAGLSENRSGAYFLYVSTGSAAKPSNWPRSPGVPARCEHDGSTVARPESSSQMRRVEREPERSVLPVREHRERSETKQLAEISGRACKMRARWVNSRTPGKLESDAP